MNKPVFDTVELVFINSSDTDGWVHTADCGYFNIAFVSFKCR